MKHTKKGNRHEVIGREQITGRTLQCCLAYGCRLEMSNTSPKNAVIMPTWRCRGMACTIHRSLRSRHDGLSVRHGLEKISPRQIRSVFEGLHKLDAVGFVSQRYPMRSKRGKPETNADLWATGRILLDGKYHVITPFHVWKEHLRHRLVTNKTLEAETPDFKWVDEGNSFTFPEEDDFNDHWQPQYCGPDSEDNSVDEASAAASGAASSCGDAIPKT